MLTTVLKHYMGDVAIGLFFDVVGRNFATSTVSYVGGHWFALDDDNNIVAYGYCTEQKGNIIVLDRGDGDYIVHTELFRMKAVSRYDISLARLMEDDDDEGSDEYNP